MLIIEARFPGIIRHLTMSLWLNSSSEFHRDNSEYYKGAFARCSSLRALKSRFIQSFDAHRCASVGT
jgi:hypothetical protein